MTIDEFLRYFEQPKPTRKGWDVRCPAHADTNPSLGVMEGDEGRIVLNCFAGCRPEDICSALGLRLADLFQDAPSNGAIRPQPHARRRSLKDLSFEYEIHALDLTLAADRILLAARACEDCDTWTDDERDLAMKIVAQAYRYHTRASWCREYADHLRERAYEPA